MVIAIVFILVIYYFQNTSTLDSLSYDNSTVTASDYTVEMDITSEMYQIFLANDYEAVKDE